MFHTRKSKAERHGDISASYEDAQQEMPTVKVLVTGGAGFIGHIWPSRADRVSRTRRNIAARALHIRLASEYARIQAAMEELKPRGRRIRRSV